MQQQNHPISGSIGQLIGKLWIRMTCGGCGYTSRHDPLRLSRRYSKDLLLTDLQARGKCGRCDARRCTLKLEAPATSDSWDMPAKE